MDEPYRVEDPDTRYVPSTGIYVRALDRGQWVSADIADLDADSLHRWLRSRGNNPLAEKLVLMLLGHEE
jgi:hypothetical protein